MITKDDRAAKKYYSCKDYECQFLIDSLRRGFGQYGLEDSNYLAAHRMMNVYGFSKRATLKTISSFTGIFN